LLKLLRSISDGIPPEVAPRNLFDETARAESHGINAMI
jgi:hypothetical protein